MRARAVQDLLLLVSMLRSLTPTFDLLGGRIVKAFSRVASLIGIGIVEMDSREYRELLEAYRTANLAHKMGDFASANLLLSKQFSLRMLDGRVQKRNDYTEQLKHRFTSQTGSDYREEPMHFVIGRRNARVGSRIYSVSLINKDGKVARVEERAEVMSTWIRVAGGWMRHRMVLHTFEQNLEWVTETVNTECVDSRIKYTD